MKLIFMGTPDFSVGVLEALLAAGHEIALVVTQPDQPKGRGKAVQAPPVKQAAVAHGLTVYQPRRVRDLACMQYLKEFAPDAIVVVAFGQILPKELLELPRYCCVNVHASLLPKYRGAAPIQWAVINGEKVSGVTTMRMDEGVDTGDMILKEEVVLDEKETGGSLFERLSVAGAALCVRTLAALEAGTAVFTPQDSSQATHTKMIKKQLGAIDFTKSAVEIERLIRGLNPWPSAYTSYKGKTLKIWSASVISEQEASALCGCGQTCAPEQDGGRTHASITVEDAASKGDMHLARVPGQVVLASGDRLYVQTGCGLLSLEEVQLEGKKRMDLASFLRGNPITEGELL